MDMPYQIDVSLKNVPTPARQHDSNTEGRFGTHLFICNVNPNPKSNPNRSITLTLPQP